MSNNKPTRRQGKATQVQNTKPSRKDSSTGEQKNKEREVRTTTSRFMLTDFLPTTKKEVELRKWNELDVILFSADAYIDHPAFGAAVIGRTLELQATELPLCHNPTGTAISEISRS